MTKAGCPSGITVRNPGGYILRPTAMRGPKAFVPGQLVRRLTAIPPTGGRTSNMAQLTGGVFETKGWLVAHERQAAKAFKIESIPLAVAGEREWTDTALIWG